MEKTITIKNLNARQITEKGKKYDPLNDNDILAIAEELDKVLSNSGILCEIELTGIQTNETDEKTTN